MDVEPRDLSKVCLSSFDKVAVLHAPPKTKITSLSWGGDTAGVAVEIFLECVAEELDLQLWKELDPAHPTNYVSFVSSTGTMQRASCLFRAELCLYGFVNQLF